MTPRQLVALATLMVACAAPAGADTRVVRISQVNATTAAHAAAGPMEERTVLSFGDERLRVDSGDLTLVVRLDLQQLYVIDHDAQAYSVLELPVQPAALLPSPAQRAATDFEVTLSATDDFQQVGPWRARRYDLRMRSAAALVESKLWLSSEPELDHRRFRSLYEPVILLQPGTAELARALRDVVGFEVARDSTVTVAGQSPQRIVVHESVRSVEPFDPPDRFYDPPVGFAERPFGLQQLMGP